MSYSRARAGLSALGVAFCSAVLPAQTPVDGAAAQALANARAAYNAGQFDQAIASAMTAGRSATMAAPAGVVLARARLEKFRASQQPSELSAAHDVLNLVDPSRLSARDRQEYTIGLGLTAYFEGRPGAASELLEVTLDATVEQASGPALGARQALFDWWATAVDRAAQLAPEPSRREFYRRIADRSEAELGRDTYSIPAGYWLAAAARGQGDLDRAWNTAIAAWIRSKSAPQRETARADLDLLVTTAIIPERARLLAPQDAASLAATLRTEWEEIKKEWAAPLSAFGISDAAAWRSCWPCPPAATHTARSWLSARTPPGRETASRCRIALCHPR